MAYREKFPPYGAVSLQKGQEEALVLSPHVLAKFDIDLAAQARQGLPRAAGLRRTGEVPGQGLQAQQLFLDVPVLGHHPSNREPHH